MRRLGLVAASLHALHRLTVRIRNPVARHDNDCTACVAPILPNRDNLNTADDIARSVPLDG